MTTRTVTCLSFVAVQMLAASLPAATMRNESGGQGTLIGLLSRPRPQWSYGLDGQLVIGFGPGLAGQHVVDRDVAFLYQPGLRVDNAEPLFYRLNRFAFHD